MILLNEYELSKWAYFEYENGNRTPEIESLITHPTWIHFYKVIKNVPKIKTGVN